VKKIIVILSCLVLSFNLISQNVNLVYDDLSSKFSQKLANELLLNISKIKQVANKDTVLVQISKIDNIDGQQTKNSHELGYRITHYLQKSLNSTTFSHIFFSFSSPYSQNQSPSSPQYFSADYDFFITGEYFFDDTNIYFSKFKMSHFHSPFVHSFDDYNFYNDSIDLIKNYDEDYFVEDDFERFIDFTKNSDIINDVILTYQDVEVKSSLIDRLGKVYNINYDTDYDISVELTQNAYLYIFYFDPGDLQHHYIQVITPKNSTQNIILNNGINQAILPSYLFFTQSAQSADYHYIKMIFSKNKLNILKYYEKDTNIGDNFYYINQTNTQELINLLTILDDIQTFTFLLTLK